ncbi:MAG: serine O-acetyltransferase [Clostridia bacterium]|nr:serine O-acetyltransferase [Clostridia bacterium]
MLGRTAYDIKSILERDPAARNAFEVALLYPGFHAVLFHRFAHMLYKCGLRFIPRLISQLSRFFTKIEIHPGATIGKGLLIDHGCGVVIGETTVIGNDCTIYQGVTLGGTGKETGKRHPTLGNNVMVGAGAKILGPFTVGDNCKIAANAVLLREVEPDSTCVGVPARVVKRGAKRVNDLDQVHIPDPVSQELCKMAVKIDALTMQIEELKNNNDNER